MPDQLSLTGAEYDPHPWQPEALLTLRDGSKVRLRRVLVQDERALAGMEHVCSSAGWIAYDTETSGLYPWLGARIIGHALAAWIDTATIVAWYVPVRHIGAHNEAEAQLDPALVAACVDRILHTPGRVGLHHAKFDWSMLRADGGQWPLALVREESGWRDFDDTSLMACIANENEPSFSLKRLGKVHVLADSQDDQDEVGAWAKIDARKLGLRYKQRSRTGKADEGDTEEADYVEDKTYLERFGHSRVPLKLEGRYACGDVLLTLLLQRHYAWVRDRYARVYERERAAERELHEMEWNGLPAAPEEIHAVHDAMKNEVAYWITKARTLIGSPTWTGTDEEMRTLFYTTWALPVPKETGTAGKASVDKESRLVLARSRPEFGEALRAIDKLQKARKLRSTYALGFLRYVTGEGRIHPTYNQLEGRDEGGFTVTGRMSSSDPNIQNVAKKPIHLRDCGCASCVTDDGHEPGEKRVISIRRYFTVPKGFVRAYIDYSQIELRILAWYSQDPKLLDCYARGLDVHAMVADMVCGGDREIAKQVNFGNSYGMSEHGLARRIVWIDPATGRKMRYYDDPDEAVRRAAKILEDYFKWLTGIPTFRRDMALGMKKNGCQFENPFGRPRRIPEIAWSGSARGRAERKMMSSVISGTAADLMKEGLLRCASYLRQSQAGRIVQSIHDEIVFDLHAQPGWPAHLRALRDLMVDFPIFPRGGVPVLASVSVTTSTWEEKRDLELLSDGGYRLA